MTFSVTILGSNSALPTLTRNPSAQVLNVNERLFLIDCAEGTQLQFLKYKIKFQRINHIFISHLHGDHYFGLMGLLFSYHLLGRENELNIYSSSELEDIINAFIEAADASINYPIKFHSLVPNKSEVILYDDLISVRSFPLKHSIPTWGFVFREKKREKNIRKDFVLKEDIPDIFFNRIKQGEDYINPDGKVYKNSEITYDPPKPRSYAYCSDTRYHEPVIPVIKDVDLLYHEATFMEDMVSIAAQKLHSTAKQAAIIASKANVKQLIIGHFSARYEKLDELLQEAKNVFDNCKLADDGKVFKVI